MESKYIAIVYDDQMNDLLKTANVIGTFDGVKVDSNGRYNDMPYYEIGFDFKLWKQLRDAKVDIDYIDDESNLYSLCKGRCNNRNVKIKLKDVLAEEAARVESLREQKVLKEKYISLVDENGIAEYKEKKTNVVPSKKANSLVACLEDSDLVMPFREIINGSDSLPIFIYLHDKKSRGTSNATLLLKECKTIISTLKASGQEFIMVIPNVVESYGMKAIVDGRETLVENSLNKLLKKVIDYEIAVNNGDAKRVYIMGAGSGVGDVLSEISTSGEIYAGAILAFGNGYYDYKDMDKYSNVTFEVVSASDDLEYEDAEISNLVTDIKDTGATVNYQELDGKPQQAAKLFYKDTSWLTNIFNVSKTMSAKPVETKIEPASEAAQE